MENIHIKKVHISESKFRQLLKLFCIDLTAVQMVKILQIERKTVNRILQLLRERIVEPVEKEFYFKDGEIEVDESYYGAKRVRGKRGLGAGRKTKVFGTKKEIKFILKLRRIARLQSLFRL